MNLESLLNRLEKIGIDDKDKQKFDDILLDLKNNIINNGKVNKGMISVMKKINQLTKDQPTFQNVYISKNGNYCICSGFMLVDYGKNIENVPKSLQGYVNQEKTENNLDYETLKSDNILNTEIINVKNLQKLVKYNKITEKTDNTFVRIPFYAKNTLFDADFLLDILCLLDIKEDTINIEYGSNVSAINIKSKNGNAILLPIKEYRNKEEEKNSKNEFIKIMNS